MRRREVLIGIKWQLRASKLRVSGRVFKGWGGGGWGGGEGEDSGL